VTGTDCAHVEDRAVWVLGALTTGEAERYAAHLEACQPCQAEVAVLQEAADAIVAAAPPAAPPPGLEARLMEQIRDEAQLLLAASAPARARPRARRRVGPAAALAAAMVALALLAGAFVIGRSTAGSPDPPPAGAERLVVAETEARATLRPIRGGALLRFDELGPPPPGRVYQVWLRRPGAPLASTNRLFSVTEGGQAIVALPPLEGVEEIVVTAERPTGSESPSLPPVLVARPAGGSRFAAAS